MSKIYNNFNIISSDLSLFINSCHSNLSKPLLKNIPSLILSMINSQSVITANMASSISSVWSSNELSNQKKIWRILNNKHLNIYSLYHNVISSIVSNISNVRHNLLTVTLDHMFTKNNFVTLMFTLKIDNQGIPLVFRTERTLSNCHSEIQKLSRKKLFSESFIISLIDEVIELLSPLNTQILFLADRWFFNLSILKHIQNKGAFFCFRAKANSSVRFLLYDKHEKHSIYKHLSDLHQYVYRSSYYNDIELGDMKLKCNLSISRLAVSSDEPWFIVSNLPPKIAIKKYSHRFASIEMFFKAQKTDGFYLEKTKTRNSLAFENLYGILCIAQLWLAIIGTDYIKNYRHYKKTINIRFNKKTKSGHRIRILSTFKLALRLFHAVFNSSINFRLKTNFKLYL